MTGQGEKAGKTHNSSVLVVEGILRMSRRGDGEAEMR